MQGQFKNKNIKINIGETSASGFYKERVIYQVPRSSFCRMYKNGFTLEMLSKLDLIDVIDFETIDPEIVEFFKYLSNKQLKFVDSEFFRLSDKAREPSVNKFADKIGIDRFNIRSMFNKTTYNTVIRHNLVEYIDYNHIPDWVENYLVVDWENI